MAEDGDTGTPGKGIWRKKCGQYGLQVQLTKMESEDKTELDGVEWSVDCAPL